MSACAGGLDADAIVAGAGLAGLVAGLRLQQAGRRTLILERSERAGGLCGTFEEGGFEFVVGCNDFGSGFVRLLDALGVRIAFHHPRARFHFGSQRIELPPDAGTVARLLLRAPELVRTALGARRAVTLGELVDRHIREPLLADLACLPAFAMMRSPDDVPLCALAADFSRELGYGYDRSCTPVGGPQALVDAMVARFLELGGTLRLGTSCLGSERAGELHRVQTPQGELRTRALLSSAGRWHEYPGSAKPGLDVAVVLLVVRSVQPFPPALHTLDWFASGVASELRRLDAGQAVDEPSFHTFRSDLGTRDGCYTVNALVPLPRGEHDPPEARRLGLVAHVRRSLEQIWPGADRAVRRATFVSPAEYEARFGFRPRPSQRILSPGVAKPPGYDPVCGVHHLGTSVDPPGEHAGAAALSGWRAAGAVLEVQRASLHPEGASP